MATEAFIQVAPDSTGKKVRNVEVVSPGLPDTGTVEQEVVTIADGSGVLVGPVTQGAIGTTATGPIAQGVVNDTPSSFNVGEMQALSITTDGRLRVATKTTDFDLVWNQTFANPWGSGDAWTDLPSAADADVSSGGQTSNRR